MQRWRVCQSTCPTDYSRCWFIRRGNTTTWHHCFKNFTGFEYTAANRLQTRGSDLSLPAWPGTVVLNRQSSSYSRRRVTSTPAVSDDQFAGRSVYTLIDYRRPFLRCRSVMSLDSGTACRRQSRRCRHWLPSSANWKLNFLLVVLCRRHFIFY